MKQFIIRVYIMFVWAGGMMYYHGHPDMKKKIQDALDERDLESPHERQLRLQKLRREKEEELERERENDRREQEIAEAKQKAFQEDKDRFWELLDRQEKMESENTIIEENIKRLFRFHAPGSEELKAKGAMLLETDFRGKKLRFRKISRSILYIEIRQREPGHMKSNFSELNLMGKFQIPLHQTRDAPSEILYLLGTVDTNADVPEPLCSAVHSIMKGWLPIFNALHALTGWKYTNTQCISHYNRYPQQIPTLESPSSNQDFPLADEGTYTFFIELTAEYTVKTIGERLRLKKSKKVADDLFKDKTLKIVSWVKDSFVFFKIKSEIDEIYNEFSLNDINALIEKLIHYFPPKPAESKIYKQVSELVDRVGRMAGSITKGNVPK
jgi:hypothetical protein